MAYQIGIDLGTTNSAVAYMEGGEAHIIPSADGGRTTPSVVAFTKDGERLVGAPAKRQASLNPGRTVVSVKRRMGSAEAVRIDGRSYSPEEISAIILKKLKKDAEEYLGEPVSDAVITVPAYFTDAQRQATKDAGAIAGLNVTRIINEPTAAALAYGADKEAAQKIMVYDLGGGTFDVSVLSVDGGVIEVLATAGNNRLGGDDFDMRLRDMLIDEFRAKEHIDLRRDPIALERVREAAENAKIELSTLTETVVNLPFLAGDKSMDTRVTRARFESLTADLIEATRAPVEAALKDAGIWVTEIDKILLVGGSTRMPAVEEFIKKITGKQPFRGINPDECVAMGASLQAGVLSGGIKGLLLLDVTPLSLGIETYGDQFSRIIERNTSIPIRKSQIFTTTAPFQSSVDVHVLQGESPRASQNKKLGTFRLTGIRRAPAGQPKIEVTFDIDANGIVHVSARDVDTGKSQDIVITSREGMSREEIDAAIAAGQRAEEEERTRKDQAETRAHAEELLREAHAAMKTDKNPALKGAYKTLKAALHGKNNRESLENAVRELEEQLRLAGRN